MSCFGNLIAKLHTLIAFIPISYSCSGAAASSACRSESRGQPEFVNLAPTNEADEKGNYYRALSFATNDPDIQNIALTGPYGSGKSSVIQTFLTKYEGSVLQVSLAAFVPEVDSIEEHVASNTSRTPIEFDKNNIERSILQQMLYGADANKLPLSRFNRIQSPPECAPLVSLLSLIGVISTIYLLTKSGELFNGELLTPFKITNWFNYLTLPASGVFLWYLIHNLYLQTFGISLKSVSLKNIELTSSTMDETSILNKHLDEIIYFFQSTDYDLVIFEDLDRFKDPSIFVTLREINNLINANAGVKRKIRFLYALRDDIFVNTERTKFFEFIVPIIPIINHSNSIDKVLEQVERLDLTEKLDNQFLGEVSRYLTDMRLIRSIFNEFRIYSSSLEDDDGNVHNPDKLLAILIYKNVLPRDFENLHKQRGVLAEILDQYDEYVSKKEDDYKKQISILENEILEINEQFPKCISELNSIYAMALVHLLPAGYSHLNINSKSISLEDLIASDEFETLIFSNKITTGNFRSHNLAVDTSSLQKRVDSQDTYSDRKRKIEKKNSAAQASIHERIRKIKKTAVAVKKEKFHVTIQASKSQVSKILLKAGENAELLQYLIFEGYLDDTYYNYISLFHEGRMSPNDNKYLINIRGFKNPNPEFKIDNPFEVIKAMRDEDFSQNYILNHTLVDFLFDNPTIFSKKITSALQFISENFDESADFHSGYYTSGKNVGEFIHSLSKQWPWFASRALESNFATDHIARILSYVPRDTIVNSLNKNNAITDFLSASAQQVFNHELEIEPGKLKALAVKISDLSTIEEHADLLSYIIKNNLYEIYPNNISFILSRCTSPSESEQLATSNLTTIFNSGNAQLTSYIKQNYDTYFEEVFFFVKTNTNESLETLRQLLSEEDILLETKENILATQKTVFPSFEGVPKELYSCLLQHRTIEPSWEHLIQYRNSDAFDNDELTEYIKHSEVYEILKSSKIPTGEEAFDLGRFILCNEDLEDQQYRTYVQKLPQHFSDFPENLSHEKLLILIESNRVRLNGDSFNYLEGSIDLLAALLTTNIDEYLKNKADYIVGDDVRELLISSSISNNHKFALLKDISTQHIVKENELAKNIANVLVALDFDPASFDFRYLESVITNAENIDTQILLLNKCQADFDNEQVSLIVKIFPHPFSKITKFGTAPKIPNNEENRKFADWLYERKLISSWSEEIKLIRINTFRKEKDD